MERIGSGIKRIYELMEEADLPVPKFSTKGMFVATLSRPSQRRKELGKTVGETMVQTVGESLNSTSAKIIELIKINPYVTSKELAEGLKLTIRGIEYNLKILKDNNYIERIGANKGGYWKIL